MSNFSDLFRHFLFFFVELKIPWEFPAGFLRNFSFSIETFDASGPPIFVARRTIFRAIGKSANVPCAHQVVHWACAPFLRDITAPGNFCVIFGATKRARDFRLSRNL